MQDLRDQIPASERVGLSTAAIFMQHVYSWMTAALLVTAGAAYFTINSEAMLSLLLGNGIVGIIVPGIAMIALVIYLNSAISRLSAGQATALFMAYAAIMGIFLAPVLLVSTQASITKAFVVTAGTFGGMSIYGYVTKRDLSGMGSFLMMGVWGLILAMIVNIFMQSSALDFGISIIGVLVFTGLAAYDTQKIRQMGENAPLDDSLAIRRGAILGALQLYLDFVNLFLFLLRIFNSRN